MKILVGGWFDLPGVGRDVTYLLMKEGVVHDRAMGFKLDFGTDIQAAVRTVSVATREEVELSLRCFVCGKVACVGCPYLSSCERTNVSTLCLCGDHSPEKSVFDVYAKTFDIHLKA